MKQQTRTMEWTTTFKLISDVHVARGEWSESPYLYIYFIAENFQKSIFVDFIDNRLTTKIKMNSIIIQCIIGTSVQMCEN